MVHDYLAVDATFAAASKMITGAGVVKDFVAKTADFPETETELPTSSPHRRQR